MHVEAHLSLTELKRLVRAEQDVKLAKRTQMVVLALEGYTAPAIGRSLSSSRRVCQHWVEQYNAHGLKGLADKKGRGKPPLLTPEEQERIDAGPTEEDGVCTLRGKDIQHILAEEFGKVHFIVSRPAIRAASQCVRIYRNCEGESHRSRSGRRPILMRTARRLVSL